MYSRLTSIQVLLRHCLLVVLSAAAVLGVGGSYATRRAAAFDISATPVTTVSAASFEQVPVAPESIVSAFGLNLATRTASATTQPLPTELGGSTVKVNGQSAQLFFVSPNQINYLIPASIQPGNANVEVRSSDGTISLGVVPIVSVAPGVFTANGSGRGVAAANVLRIRANGTFVFESVSVFNETLRRFVTRPIDLSAAGERVFLVLFVTGVRRANDPNGDGNLNESVRVLLGGNEITPLDARRQPDFAGLDQINAEIPKGLIGRGIVNLSVTVGGFTPSNLAEIEIAGSGGSSPPQVMAFMPPDPALAGQQLIIAGSGFAANPAGNIVRISGLDAKVMEATAAQLKIIVPFNVQSGRVSVSTALGEGLSTAVLPVRTSISGFVENTAQQPLGNVPVRLVSNPGIMATTTAEGSFVLPLGSEPAGVQFVEVDGGAVPTTPPYPKVTLKIITDANRDNQFARAIALQQATGSGGSFGNPAPTAAGARRTLSYGRLGGDAQQQQLPRTAQIQTGNFIFQYPESVTATFPATVSGRSLFLTPIQHGRAPIELPVGLYSSSIVQITPFNVRLDPGGKLILPNSEGLPPGLPVKLFRYDPEKGQVVEEVNARAGVSIDGQRIETGPNDIKLTSFYFTAVSREQTTVVGRVLEAGGQPIGKAVVRLRGQEAMTDGNGSYILRFVPATAGESITADISLLRPTGRVDRQTTDAAQASLANLTRMPETRMPRETENRPPAVIAPPRIEIAAGETKEFAIAVSDPDPNQILQVSVSGASFAVLTPATGTPTKLRLTPGTDNLGNVTLTLNASDGLANTVATVAVTVVSSNRPPTAAAQELATDEDTATPVKLAGTDPEGRPLTYNIVARPAQGTLTGTAPDLTYTPAANFNGTDTFTFKVNDGVQDSPAATVKLIVRPVNDAPTINVPGPLIVNEGVPLNFTVTAADVDTNQTLTIAAVNPPDGTTLTATTATAAQFRWTPGYAQAGNYTIAFRVTDSGAPALSASKEVRVTVNDVPNGNALQSPTAVAGSEGETIGFDVTPVDPQSGPLLITATGLPTGATFTQPTPNSGRFRWTPTSAQAGGYTVTVRAVGSLPPVNETKEIRLTVFDVQRDFAREAGDFIVFGAAGPTPRVINDSGDATGTSVAVGDLNGDGIDDLAVGAPAANNGTGADVGKVYIFFGKSLLGGVSDLAVTAGQQGPDAILVGETAFDMFGSSLAIADFNGDGKNDLAAGAPLADGGQRRNCGRVYLVFGNFPPNGLGADKSVAIKTAASYTIYGARGGSDKDAGDQIGFSLAAGLVNSKTGAADLIIGAPLAEVAPSGDNRAEQALHDAGAVYVIYGGTQLGKEKDLATSPPDFTLNGTKADGQMGVAVAVGNFNGDDFADIAAGAPYEGVTGKTTNGAVYLVLGAPTLTGTRTTTQAAAVTWMGFDGGDKLGAAVAFGDLNGDGRADLAVGATGGDGPNNARRDVGEVYVFFGTPMLQNIAAGLTLYGAGTREDDHVDELGATLAIGDFTGDGFGDLIVGAPGADAVSAERNPSGAAYVIFGARTGPVGVHDLAVKAADLTLFGADADDQLGYGAFAVGNINLGEAADLICGVPLAASLNNTRRNAGEVRVLFGVKR